MTLCRLEMAPTQPSRITTDNYEWTVEWDMHYGTYCCAEDSFLRQVILDHNSGATLKLDDHGLLLRRVSVLTLPSLPGISRKHTRIKSFFDMDPETFTGRDKLKYVLTEQIQHKARIEKKTWFIVTLFAIAQPRQHTKIMALLLEIAAAKKLHSSSNNTFAQFERKHFCVKSMDEIRLSESSQWMSNKGRVLAVASASYMMALATELDQIFGVPSKTPDRSADGVRSNPHLMII